MNCVLHVHFAYLQVWVNVRNYLYIAKFILCVISKYLVQKINQLQLKKLGMYKCNYFKIIIFCPNYSYLLNRQINAVLQWFVFYDGMGFTITILTSTFLCNYYYFAYYIGNIYIGIWNSYIGICSKFLDVFTIAYIIGKIIVFTQKCRRYNR